MSLQINSQTAHFGVGLRSVHFPYLEENPPLKIDYFEIITENHLTTRGRPFQVLEKVRADYPVSFHGVSLSIAYHREPRQDYLEHLKTLIQLFDPFLVSDHLCWTGSQKANLHNLLPFAFTHENLDFLAGRIHRVQEILGRTMAFENLSAYFQFKESTMSEWEFISELVKKTDCQILLDINNIYVNSQNQDFDPYQYIEAINPKSVAQFHLAGFSDMGDFLFDTHSKPVYPEVWKLYRYAVKKMPHVPTLVEWDEDIPEFPRLEEEALKAKKIWREVHG